MRKTICMALACLFTLSATATGIAAEKKVFKKKLKWHEVTAAYSVQTASVRTGCFSPELQGILSHIAKKTGQKPLVTSGYRPRAHRSKSMHRMCEAADIRMPGISEKKILAAAKSAPGIGGVGRYCNGIVHVDTGPKRTWVYC